MKAAKARTLSSAHVGPGGGIQRGGGRLAEIAGYPAPDSSEDRVRPPVAELSSDGAVAHNPEVGLW